MPQQSPVKDGNGSGPAQDRASNSPQSPASQEWMLHARPSPPQTPQIHMASQAQAPMIPTGDNKLTSQPWMLKNIQDTMRYCSAQLDQMKASPQHVVKWIPGFTEPQPFLVFLQQAEASLTPKYGGGPVPQQE